MKRIIQANNQDYKSNRLTTSKTLIFNQEF